MEKNDVIQILDELNQNNISLYKISKETGLVKMSLSRWKRGIHTPKDDDLEILIDYYNKKMSSDDGINLIKKSSSFGTITPLMSIRKMRESLTLVENHMARFNIHYNNSITFSDPTIAEKFRDQLKEFSEKIEEMYLDRHDVF